MGDYNRARADLLPFRIEKYKQFKDFQTRIMVATDVFGRGIDIR